MDSDFLSINYWDGDGTTIYIDDYYICEKENLIYQVTDIWANISNNEVKICYSVFKKSISGGLLLITHNTILSEVFSIWILENKLKPLPDTTRKCECGLGNNNLSRRHFSYCKCYREESI